MQGPAGAGLVTADYLQLLCAARINSFAIRGPLELQGMPGPPLGAALALRAAMVNHKCVAVSLGGALSCIAISMWQYADPPGFDDVHRSCVPSCTVALLRPTVQRPTVRYLYIQCCVCCTLCDVNIVCCMLLCAVCYVLRAVEGLRNLSRVPPPPLARWYFNSSHAGTSLSVAS